MGKKKKIFNFLDVLIVLAVLGLIAGVLWRQELTQLVKQRNEENTVVILCDCTVVSPEGYTVTSLPDANTKLFYDGKEVGVLIGNVADETSTDSTRDSVTVDPDSSFTVKLSAVEKESGYYIAESKLLKGREYTFYTNMYEFTVCINEIKEDV